MPAIQGWNLSSTYTRLPDAFYSHVLPEHAPDPKLVLFNRRLANQLGLRADTASNDELAAYFSGNRLPEGAHPFAQAYAGHQFGHFTMLGDGRATVLGEQLTPSGERFDLQFKGSGKTPYSRRGDGKATLYSMLREYLISEAMHHLGIRTSRSLTVVATGEPVLRETVNDGALLTRVMESHLRVGSFEYARNFVGDEAVCTLLDYAVERHYPELKTAENTALVFLDAVMERQIALVVDWMRVGFIHGVMNTDNMGIAGVTYDYGPCAFMNAYSPSTVFSSIDTAGRYAYGQQPRIAHWNLACLAGALLPGIHPDQDTAIARAQEVLNTFKSRYAEAWLAMMRGKLGLATSDPDDAALVQSLLDGMEKNGFDYTNTFAFLRNEEPVEGVDETADFFQGWMAAWRKRVAANPNGMAEAQRLMAKANPFFIARNHVVEELLSQARDGRMESFHLALHTLSRPYDAQADVLNLRGLPPKGSGSYKTYCGT
ncbi:MAG: YdiU family protein [Flavobacteriales bacterium]